jgi:hypothetical protein
MARTKISGYVSSLLVSRCKIGQNCCVGTWRAWNAAPYDEFVVNFVDECLGVTSDPLQQVTA